MGRSTDKWAAFIFLFVFSSVNSQTEFITAEPVDQDTCPRNREEAAARGRQCLRKCKSDADCISSRKRCLCDGMCGWSCVRPDLNCEELPPVENGQLKVTGDYFGAKVIYTCNEGFWMSGPKERVCQGDGSWSDNAAECKKKAMCRAPPLVPHARHSAAMDKDEFDIDALVQYNCFPGYEAKGFARAKCLFYNSSAQWFGPDLRCIPRSCGHPGEIENGRREGTIFTFSSRVTYHCLDGYELVGRANRYCQSNGQWSGVVPTCRPVQCPLPEDPINGRASYTAITFNSVVKYECRYGYTLVGPLTRKCGANKQWEGDDPRCDVVDCGSPGVLHNGYLEGQSTTLGSVIIFRCFDGMKFEGPSMSTTCQSNGSWSHALPNCLAPCIVPEVEHGRVNQVAPGSRVAHGQHIMVDCKPQYELIYNNTPAVCNNGTWTHVPICVPARCKQLPDRPRHGIVIAPKTDHGMKALYRCRDGYELVGPNVTECNFGKWTTPTPVCKEIYCPFPGFIEHGRVLLVGHMGMYDYRPYVRKVTNNRQIMYECDRGYTLMDGPSGATCVDGQWSPKELPQCVRGSHPLVRWIRSANRHQKEKDTALRHTSNMRERREGTGRPVRQRRAKEPCKPVAQAPWMEVEIVKMGVGNDTIPHGTVLRVTCSYGYGLNIGNRTARCVRGRWKPREPECVTLPCEVPRTRNVLYYHYQMVVAEGSSIPHGELVTLACVPGYQLMGHDALRCWYGDWAVESVPECLPGPCELPLIPHGYYLNGYRAGLTISHGSFVEYSCKGTFVKASNEALQCYEGRVRPQPPACINPDAQSILIHGGQVSEEVVQPVEDRRNKSCTYRNTEPNLVSFHGDRKVTEEVIEFPPGTELVFRCRDIGKFSLIGSIRRRCIHGDWDGVKPSCFGLSQENDYALEKPPTILFRHQLGPIAQSNNGKLIVYPGTILHLECLWIRKYGTPRWEVSHSYRKYPEGWTNEPGRDPQLEYRLSIYHAQKDDSGRFTCITPMHHRHSVDIVVAAVHCPPIPEQPGLHVSNPSTKMNTKVVFSCKDGQVLLGSEQATCLSSGNWSAPPPICQVTECPDLTNVTEEFLTVQVSRTDVGGKALFSCAPGYGLRGAAEATCTETGEWSDPVPYCEEVTCEAPDVPQQGYLQGSGGGLYRGGDVLQFACNTGHMMEGAAIVVCQENGRWSAPPPTCVPACTYPGPTPGGTISSVKFYYRVNETVTFDCAEGYELRGAKILSCLDNGRWSSAVPVCHLKRKG